MMAELKVRPADFYGAPLGVLLIDSSEPYLPGDVGNASTWSVPARYEKVHGCTIDRLVMQGDMQVRDAVVDSALRLEAAGARVVTSNCGFMLRHQEAVAAALSVPVVLSSLLQLPLLLALTGPYDQVGIVTASAPSLTPELLALAGASPTRLALAGLEGGPAFCRAFLHEQGAIDRDAVEAEVVGAARALCENERAAVILLECAVLAPYAAAIQTQLGVPVFDFTTLVEHCLAGSLRRPFTGFY